MLDTSPSLAGPMYCSYPSVCLSSSPRQKLVRRRFDFNNELYLRYSLINRGYCPISFNSYITRHTRFFQTLDLTENLDSGKSGVRCLVSGVRSFPVHGILSTSVTNPHSHCRHAPGFNFFSIFQIF